MALGTPVIGTDVTGIPELVRDGETGLCVPEGDPEALAEGLARLLASHELRQETGGGGAHRDRAGFRHHAQCGGAEVIVL